MRWILKHPRLFFLLLSLAFWVGSRFSADGLDTELRYQLKYSGLSEEIERKLPLSVGVKLTGGGYFLFKEWINPFRTIRIDRADLDQTIPNWKGGMKLNSLAEIIEQEFSEQLTLVAIDHGNTLVDFPEIRREWWVVDHRIPEGLRKEGFIIDFKNLPDSLALSRSVDDVFPQENVQLEYKGEFPGIGTHIIELIPYNSSSSVVYFDVDMIQAEITIDLATTVYRTVDVNEVEGSEGILTPSSVELAFSVPLRQIEDFQSYPITASVVLDNKDNFRHPLLIEMHEKLEEKLIYISNEAVTFIPSNS